MSNIKELTVSLSVGWVTGRASGQYHKLPLSFCLSLSVLTAIFLSAPGVAGTRMFQFWILLELRVMKVVMGLEL